MTRPIVSVIIPVYNGEKYIQRAINSVLFQPQYKEIEVIVVDDGSVDNTGSICDDYSMRFSTVHVIHKMNGGVANARNSGMKIANGKYLAFLDSDDWWSENFFDKELFDTLLCSDVDLFSFGYADISFDIKFITEYHVVNETDIKNERVDVNAIGAKYPYYPSWTLFYRREFIIANGIRLFSVKYNEDFSFSHRCLALAKKITYIDRILYNVYSNSASAMHGKNQMVLYIEHCKALKYMKKWYSDSGYGCFEIEKGVLNIFAQTLPYLCAYNTFDDVRLSEPGFLKYLDDYHVNLGEAYYQRLLNYSEKKRSYWINHRVFFRPFCDAIHLICKLKRLHALFNSIYYSIRHRERVSTDELLYLERLTSSL